MSGISNGTCYNADGSVSNDIPCNFSSIFTCCGSNWDCMSNGLCREHGTTAYSQSTCTDPDFQNCLSFCNQDQFDGYTEVSRCEASGNSWCCAGAAGQGLGGPDCCMTNLTTSLEPYPFSTIDRSGQSPATEPTSLASSASASSATTPPTSSTTAPPESSASRPLTSSASMQPTSHKHISMTGIEIGVPMAIIIVFLTGLAFFIFRKNRKQKQGLSLLQSEIAGDPLRQKSELAANPLSCRPGVHEHRGDPVWELDVTRYELPQPDAPRHELGHAPSLNSVVSYL